MALLGEVAKVLALSERRGDMIFSQIRSGKIGVAGRQLAERLL